MWIAVLVWLGTMLEAYMLGSIDTGIIVSKLLYHDDVRTHGSGAAGMTNMLRTFGKKAAAMTAFGDVLKSFIAVRIGMLLFAAAAAHTGFPPLCGGCLAALFALIGHLCPLYFEFRGGKGVLVAAGAILAMQWPLIFVLAAIFLVCFLPTRMVSLGSIVMAVSYPFLTVLYGVFVLHLSTQNLVITTTCAVLIGGIIVYMHRSNIKRILAGTEYRFDGKHKKQ